MRKWYVDPTKSTCYSSLAVVKVKKQSLRTCGWTEGTTVVLSFGSDAYSSMLWSNYVCLSLFYMSVICWFFQFLCRL